MLPNLTLKQERFLDHYQKTGSATQAYELAYDAKNMKKAVIHKEASLLLKNRKISEWITAAKANAAKQTNVTVASLIEELDEARALALKLEQPSAAVQASIAKAKLSGNWVDRKEIGGPGDFQRMSDAELDRMIAEGSQQLTLTAEPEDYQDITEDGEEQTDIEDAIAELPPSATSE